MEKHVSIKKGVRQDERDKMAQKKKVRDPSGTYPFLVKYRCYITTKFHGVFCFSGLKLSMGTDAD